MFSVHRFNGAAGYNVLFCIVLLTSIGSSQADCTNGFENDQGGSCAVCTCGNHLFCESGICKAKAGTNCGTPPTCVNGTTCGERNGQFICLSEVGEECSTSNSYCNDGLECDSATTPDECAISFGQGCAGDLADHCLTNSACEDDVCRITLDQSCASPNNDYCLSALTCDSDDVCKHPAGHNCTVDTDCAAGTMCESELCKVKLGENCANVQAGLCVTGSTCDQDLCRLDAGEDCDGDKADKCGTALDCEGDVCKLNVDGNCAANSTLCKDGLGCNNGLCKMEVGGNCVDDANVCGTGTVCDVYVCKLQTGESCTGSNWGYCMCGTLCENDLCKLNTGESCAGNTGHCRSGTTCENDVCKLDYGEGCQGNEQHCMETTTCDDGSGTVCKKKAEIQCSNDTECVNNAQCDSSCSCLDGFTQDHASGLCIQSSSTRLSGSILLLLPVLLSCDWLTTALTTWMTTATPHHPRHSVHVLPL